jgi:signal transduction histidine kinase
VFDIIENQLMTIKSLQNLTIFKRLNSKIVIYFLSFAFLPLLAFSIFGYYLNKDLITRINFNNLQSLNEATTKEFNLYLQSKNRVIIQAVEDYESIEKTGSLQVYLNNRNDIKTDFIEIEVVSSTEEATALHRFYEKLPDRLDPCILIKINNFLIFGCLDPGEIADLLSSNVKEIQNSVYFLNVGKKLVEGSLSSIEEGELKRLNENLSETNSETIPISIEEEGYLVSFSFIADQNIYILTRIDTQNFYADLVSFRNKILFANIVFAVILILLAIIFSRHITTPIHKLIEASHKIGQGNLEEKIDVNTNDEIMILASEFELMRTRLQESYQGMEEKIERRTQELQEAQAQISHQEKMASLGMMAAGIAHEIGNPLTSISSMAQVIKRRNENPQISEYVTNILKNIDRISRIVRELVDFSRPSSYKEAISDINEIIKSAVGIIKYDRRSKNLKYMLILDPELPKTIIVSDHLLQVFLNILINSVDASEGFGDEITVKSFSKSGNVYVEITDKGSGIRADIQKKIFEPFYTTKEVGKGTGLGLTVSYGFIQKLNGEIKVKSDKGKGSTFTVIFPVRSHIEE